MSAAMQKAAAVLGACEVFHVLADNCCLDDQGNPRPPQTIQEILEAHANGHLHLISLGSEGGWPQFHTARPEDYPLNQHLQDDGAISLTCDNHNFRAHLRAIVERSHNIAGAWQQLPELPFPILATWPQPQLEWLQKPLDPEQEHDRNWVASLPKVELHCHLGGFATDGKLLEDVRSQARDPHQLPQISNLKPPAGWPLPPAPISLQNYMDLGNNSGSALLKDPGCLRRHCELLYQHLRQQNVLYAEIRCSPANYASEERSPWQVLCEIRETFHHCMNQQPGCHVNLILIATRRKGGDYRAQIARHLALAITAAEHWLDQENEAPQCRVVGVDLAGYEDVTTRAHYYREEFIGVHRCGLALTVHAGENDDAEGIWRAVFDLSARRLGHALKLGQSPDLMRSIAARRIGVEMCPYANYQIQPFAMPGQHTAHPPRNLQYPLLNYLRQGIRVSVNTDNIGISAANLTDNLLLAARLCPGLTRLDILKLQRHALETAFLTPAHRQQLLREFPQQLASHRP
jgi:adenosine deaminase